MARLEIEKMEAVATRPLSDNERAHYDLYMDIVEALVKDMTCFDLAAEKEVPADLYLVLSDMFLAVQDQAGANATRGIVRKHVEDFEVTYENGAIDRMAEAIERNKFILLKYSRCENGIRYGASLPVVNSSDGRGYASF